MGQPVDQDRTVPEWLKFAVPIVGLLALFFSPTLLRDLYPSISRGLAFCLTAAIMFLIVIGGNALLNPASRSSDFERKTDIRDRIAKAVSAVACIIAIAAIFTGAYIEGNGTARPDRTHTVLHRQKGGDVYLTPEQLKLHDLAIGCFVGMILCGAAAGAYRARK